MTQETTALAPVMPVSSMADLAVMGDTFASSGMFGCTNKQQGMVLALTCITEKISPLKFCQTYHMIEGKPSMRADAMLAKFAERGGKFFVEEKTEKRAAIRLVKDGNDQTFSMTIDQAMAEPFPWYTDKTGKRCLKKNWATPWMQKCMIWARVVSDGVRTIDPGVNMGVYTPEETMDFTETGSEIKEPREKKKAENAPMKTVKGEVVDKPEHAKAVNSNGEQAKTVMDFSTFPDGKLKGTKFEDADDKTLEFVLNPACAAKYPEFQQGHLDYVKSLLMDRAPTKSTGTETNEPFPEE